MKITKNFENKAENIIRWTGYIITAGFLNGITLVILYFEFGWEPMFIINPAIFSMLFAVACGIVSLVLVGILRFGKYATYQVEYHKGCDPIPAETATFDNIDDANASIADWRSANGANTAFYYECWE